MKRSTLLDAAGNVSLIVLCLVAVMLWLRSDRPQAGQRTTRSEDTWHADWRTLLSSGTLVGEATAPVQLIELGDYQCPGCREFHKIWSAAHNRFEREGLAVGRTLKVPGTPTILVNGLMLGSPLSEKQLFLLIERVLAGNPPRRE
jgi:hypothetical protein